MRVAIVLQLLNLPEQNKGHYHIYDTKKNEVIYFTEKTCIEQINQTVYLLINNINKLLNKSNQKYIKNLKIIKRKELINKIDNIKNKMLEYEQTYYSLLR